jgi:hypothetical protein
MPDDCRRFPGVAIPVTAVGVEEPVYGMNDWFGVGAHNSLPQARRSMLTQIVITFSIKL